MHAGQMTTGGQRALGSNAPMMAGLSVMGGLNQQIDHKMGRQSKLKGKLYAGDMNELHLPPKYKNKNKMFSPEPQGHVAQSQNMPGGFKETLKNFQAGSKYHLLTCYRNSSLKRFSIFPFF